ncbi:hypothetical protein CFP56_027059 [Quercus suber]|uniref:Uncharacterized protein n=1 Tax=Quercus suber TaxID=58331 RepID=A0AAW0JYD7_QUESU
MYLQCYINENGDKVYTTKVRHSELVLSLTLVKLSDLKWVTLGVKWNEVDGIAKYLRYLAFVFQNLFNHFDFLFSKQKESPLGLATKSAHPARFSLMINTQGKEFFEEAIWIVANPAATSKLLIKDDFMYQMSIITKFRIKNP